MVPVVAQASLHTDAAHLGYGGTINVTNMDACMPGAWAEQGIWNWRDRAANLTYGELKAIGMVFAGTGGYGKVRIYHYAI